MLVSLTGRFFSGCLCKTGAREDGEAHAIGTAVVVLLGVEVSDVGEESGKQCAVQSIITAAITIGVEVEFLALACELVVQIEPVSHAGV